jgi:hypothetical protein
MRAEQSAPFDKLRAHAHLSILKAYERLPVEVRSENLAVATEENQPAWLFVITPFLDWSLT